MHDIALILFETEMLMMAGRRMIRAMVAFCIIGVAGTAMAQDEPTGILADPCASQKSPEQLPDGQWPSYIATHDFGRLCEFRAKNASLLSSGKHSPQVVFMGDSITEGWEKLDPAYFTEGKVDRGISGQTTSQMLLRFRQDVIDLHPQVVHILAGTNDVAGNTGPVTLSQVEGNLASMAELAHAHGIRVVLGSVPPAAKFPWRPGLVIGPTIKTLNAWIKDYAAHNGFVYVDYFSAIATSSGGMRDGLSSDGVHPTRKGYQVMEPLTDAAIKQAQNAAGTATR
ncbi:SGNH/GDSL hydrolase family protein [Dyella jiangningensis]|uniref:SGNH/GDSL hydrolase family protein n=1 Tax=Dyella jiangningensis TaxID=1379159 RepID=UPI00240F7475|nr:SGNH/GDSL hydrolase family protein [Dyella jiangningensis]MDG2538401.1 SGNH/GDSL hydrolase family protein [Dyella jiangningensis]